MRNDFQVEFITSFVKAFPHPAGPDNPAFLK